MLGLVAILVCCLLSALAANAAKEVNQESGKSDLRLEYELQQRRMLEKDPAPTRIKGVEPERVEFYTEKNPEGAIKREYDLYLDKFVVWCSDSSAVVSAIGNPHFIQSIKHIPNYGWEIRVHTSDIMKGKILSDKLREMDCVQGVENYAYPKEGYVHIPNYSLSFGLYKSSDTTRLKHIADSLGMKLYTFDKRKKTWHVRPKSGIRFSRLKLLNALLDSDIIKYCDMEWASGGFVIQDFTLDPYVEDQWGLYNIDNISKPDSLKYTDLDVSRAWDLATGHGVKICVIDLGFDMTNRDLQNKIVACHDCTTGKDQILPVLNPELEIKINDHGTACAGIASAIRNNNYGISGYAPDSELILVRFSNEDVVVNEETLSNAEQWAAAIKWAVDAGADVISCSLSYSKENPNIKEAVEYALTEGRNKKGCIFVNSAGNNGTIGGEITFPATLDGVMAVGGLSKDIRRYYTSSYGAALFAMAAGHEVCSLTVEKDKDDHRKVIKKDYKGTSYACPAVAAVAALVLEVFPNATASQVREIIGSTCRLPKGISPSEIKPYGAWNPDYGYGMVNAFEAVKKAIAKKTTGHSVPNIPYPVIKK